MAARVGGVIAYFFAGGAVLGRIVLPARARGANDEHDRVRRSQRVVRRGLLHFQRVLERLGIGSFECERYGAALPDGPCVIVANHPTLLDIVALLSAERETCAVVKGELFRGPWLGDLLRACGHIDAGEGSALDGAAVMNASLERLREGFSVIVFPEGTRSPEGEMLPFKRGAFELAARAGVPILPVFVECEPPVVTRQRPFWRTAPEPFRLQLVPLALIPPPGAEGGTRELRREVQRLLRERVDRLARTWRETTTDECAPMITAAERGTSSTGRPGWNGI
jgi:1-acyl-sn-glycerol-3-phosphate acyltransferase